MVLVKGKPKYFYRLWSIGGNHLKCNLTLLDCIKYNEINVRYSGVQMYVSCKKMV